jgi:alpha-ribazole phosphatase
MDLVLIRHPAPAIDTGVCYGQTDVPLAADAALSADALAARLAALDVPAPHRLLSSPLIRCSSVAVQLARRFECAAAIDARLQEIDFGAWECLRWDDIDRASLDEWAANLQHARAHGGESVAQFAVRVREGFDALAATPAASCYVLTHAGVMRVAASCALGVPLERCLQWPLGMASIVWLRRAEPSREWTLVRWNA